MLGTRLHGRAAAGGAPVHALLLRAALVKYVRCHYPLASTLLLHCANDPPASLPRGQVYGIEWCPYEQSHGTSSQFVTFGKKHIKLWSHAAGGVYAPTQLSFGKLPLQNVSSCMPLQSAEAVTWPRLAGTRQTWCGGGLLHFNAACWAAAGDVRGLADAHRPAQAVPAAGGHGRRPDLRLQGGPGDADTVTALPG